jgi:uncharacterized membrane protein YvlD (DUF360 family)
VERTILRIGLALVANFVALLLAALLLDDFTIDEVDFIWVVIVFTIVSLLTGLGVDRLLRRHAPAAIGAAGLLTTWLALLITDIVSDDVEIEGIGTWIIATLIVWGATVVLALLPPWRRAARPRRAR